MRLLLALLLLLLAGCGAAPDATSASTATNVRARTAELTVPLRAGWNAVGFQGLRVESITAPNVAGQATWDGTAYQTGAVTPAALGDTRRGFWVFATQATELRYVADGEADHLNLRTGWNLVSVAGTRPATGLRAERNGQTVDLASVVLTPFTELQSDNTSLTSEDLKPGRAYWVFAASDVTLRWANPTPSPEASPAPSASPSPSPTGGGGGGGGGGSTPTPVPSPPSQLLFTTSPSSLTAGSTFPVEVRLQGNSGATYTTPTSVTLTLASAPSGGLLSGTLTASTNNAGVATFPGLSANRAGTYVLRATAGSLSAVAPAFTVSTGAAAQLRFVHTPTGGTKDVCFNPALQVEVTDDQGNRITTDSTTQLQLVQTVGSGGLGPGPSMTVTNGLADFSLFYPGGSGAQTFEISAPGFPSLTFDATIALDAGASLAYSPAGPTTVTAGQTMSSVNVTVSNSAANAVTLAILSAPTGATLDANGATSLTATASGGSAAFTTLRPNVAGSWTLQATANGFVNRPNYTFTVTPGAATGLRFVQGSTTTDAGKTMAPAVTVESVDAFGNRTAGAGSVTLSWSGPGTLFGTLVQPLTAGLATFTGLSPGAASPAAALQATLSGLTSAQSGATRVGLELVSRSSDAGGVLGAQATAQATIASSIQRRISGNGRYVVFQTSGLGDGARVQVYRRDRWTGTNLLVSSHKGVAATENCQNPALSPDGRYVAFVTSATFGDFPNSSSGQVYLRDTESDQLALVTHQGANLTTGAGGGGFQPSVSRDGAYVSFGSPASDMVALAPNGAGQQVFRYTRATGAIEQVSVGYLGNGAMGFGTSYGTWISDDGSKVLFESGNLFSTRYDPQLVPLTSGGTFSQVYVRDFSAGTISLVSRRAGSDPLAGASGDSSFGTMASDGVTVAFLSNASDLASSTTSPTNNQAFVRTLTGTEATLASRRVGGTAFEGTANGADHPFLSGDGRYVMFKAYGTDLGVATGSQEYRAELATGTVVPLSQTVAAAGMSGGGLSADGLLGIFQATASNLGYTGGTTQVFVATP